MKAVLVHRPGGLEALELVDLPVPTPKSGEIQIRAEAYGVGQVDALIRKGVYRWMPPLPVNPGNDVAGCVSAVGSDVEGVMLGQKVLLSARDLHVRGGCYAEYGVAPADAVHILPEGVSLDEAVCLPNYQVAYAMLGECRQPRSAATVLIVGAAGGIGTALVQTAKQFGMKVIGTVSTEEKAQFALQNGADHIIFYRNENVADRVRDLTGGEGVGLIFDHVGGPQFVKYLGALSRWGTLVSYNAFTPPPEDNLLEGLRKNLDICPAVRCFNFHVYDNDRVGRRALLADAIAALHAKAIKPAIGARYKLTEVRKAHALLEDRSALGKIIMNA